MKLFTIMWSNHIPSLKQACVANGVELSAWSIKQANQDEQQWLADPEGLGAQVGWSMAMPDLEGVIEQMVVGASSGTGNPEEELHH